MKLEITDEGVEINGVLINEKIFQEEMVDYSVREREDQIDNLIDWISEATKDKEIMKSDLKYLIGLPDEYIFSSISTNEYIAKSDSEKEFDEICKDILEKNKDNGKE